MFSRDRLIEMIPVSKLYALGEEEVITGTSALMHVKILYSIFDVKS